MSEPLRATFFALQKREGGVLLGATVCYLLMWAVLAAAVFVPMLSVFNLNFSGAAPSAAPDPTAALWMVPLGFVVAFLGCVLTASYEAACLRWMIRGEKPGLFGITINQDTWRVYGLYWIWLLFYGVAWIGYFIVNGLTSRLLAENSIASLAIACVYGLLVLIAAAAFAPAAAVSIAQRRLVFGEAAQATEAHFGSLLGTYALLFGLQFVLNSAWPAIWLLWKLKGDIGTYAARATDLTSGLLAYNEAMAAAIGVPGAAQEYWVISAAMFLLSIILMVLVYGANARVALLAQQEGRLAAAA